LVSTNQSIPDLFISNRYKSTFAPQAQRSNEAKFSWANLRVLEIEPLICFRKWAKKLQSLPRRDLVNW